jgi:hypothetical protein
MKPFVIFSLCALIYHVLLPLDTTSNNAPLNNELPFIVLLKQLEKFEFSVERIAGTFVLAKQKSNAERLVIQSSLSARPQVYMEDEKIKIYTGGPQGFAWKLAHTNHFYTFNIEAALVTRHTKSKTDKIYDVIISKEGIYTYGYQRWKKKDFIRCLGQNRNYFPIKSSCTILNDNYIRYISSNNQYALIEGLPYYSPSLLVGQNPYQILGIFEKLHSNKRIAMSPNGQKYAIHSHPHFMLHDYALQKDTFYTSKLIPKPSSDVNHLFFSGTNDVLLVHYDNQLIVISFEYQKHWQREIANIQKILPCPSIAKTIIEHADGTYSYLNYNHENDTFKIVKYDV